MISEQAIREAVDRIVAAARPSKVIVFGSQARGGADEASDLDLLVIEPKLVDRYREMMRLRKAVGPIGGGADVLVCSEEEAERRGRVPDTVVYWPSRRAGSSMPPHRDEALRYLNVRPSTPARCMSQAISPIVSTLRPISRVAIAVIVGFTCRTSSLNIRLGIVS